MLDERKTYTLDQLETILQCKERKNVTAKLKRLDINYSIEGRGKETRITIDKINDRFLLYCVINLGMKADKESINKFRIFVSFYFDSINHDIFRRLSQQDKRNYLMQYGYNISKETIGKYEKRLKQHNLMQLSDDYYNHIIEKENGKYETIDNKSFTKAYKAYRKEVDYNLNRKEAIRKGKERFYKIAGGKLKPRRKEVNLLPWLDWKELYSLAKEKV